MTAGRDQIQECLVSDNVRGEERPCRTALCSAINGLACMTQLRAVFWDVDGTLADTEMDGHRPAFNAAFDELGLPIHWDPELYSRLLAIPGGLRRVRTYLSERDLSVSDETLLDLREIKRRHYLSRIQQGHVGWRPGVRRLLHALDKADVPQWIVTSSGYPSVMALLEAGGEDLPRFAGIITSDDVSEGKPSPAGYRLALQRSGCPAADGLAVEDSGVGLEAARAAGLACLLTPSPWDRDLVSLLTQAVAAVNHLGDPSNPATHLHGPPCSEGLVTLEYLQDLISGTPR